MSPGRRARRPWSLATRLMIAQGLVLIAGILTAALVAQLVGPPLFHHHLVEAGQGAEAGFATRLSCNYVGMRPFTDEEVEAYVATGDPLDKAGAYAIQHPRFAPVERWEGCYTSIMGLPLGITAEMLRAAGVTVPVDALAVCERSSGECCLRGNHGGC